MTRPDIVPCASNSHAPFAMKVRWPYFYTGKGEGLNVNGGPAWRLGTAPVQAYNFIAEPFDFAQGDSERLSS